MNERFEDTIAEIKNLPTLPTMLGKILDVVSDPQSSAVDLGQLVAVDQSLSATLLRIVNSAYYGFYRQITSVSQAIVMLGFVEVRNLALTISVFNNLTSSSKYDRVQLWRHALGTAIAAEHLAKRCNMQVTGCFEAGLLHDIGKVILDMLYPEDFLRAVEKAAADQIPLHEAENAIFEGSHCTVGNILGDHWNLPREVINAITFHHSPEETDEDTQLTDVVALANYITYLCSLGDTGNPVPPALPQFSLERLGIEESLCTEIAAELGEKQESIDDFIGALK